MCSLQEYTCHRNAQDLDLSPDNTFIFQII